MKKVGFIGAGAVGSAFAGWLAAADFTVAAVASRSKASAQALAQRVEAEVVGIGDVAKKCQLLFITTTDEAIGPVCEQVARGGFGSCRAVFHTSGALGSEVLEPAAKAGLGIASLHPIASFPRDAWEELPLPWFTIEGNEVGIEEAKTLFKGLGAKYRQIASGEKPRYHLATVFASNYLVTLLAAAEQLWQEVGLDPAEGLWSLAVGTLTAIERQGTKASLTGPIKRGDEETVRLHLEALAQDLTLQNLYRQLAACTVPLAELEDERAKRLDLLLKEEWK